MGGNFGVGEIDPGKGLQSLEMRQSRIADFRVDEMKIRELCQPLEVYQARVAEVRVVEMLSRKARKINFAERDARN